MWFSVSPGYPSSTLKSQCSVSCWGRWAWNPFYGGVLRDPVQLLLWKWTKTNVLCCTQAHLARVTAAGWHRRCYAPLPIWAAIPLWFWGLAVIQQIDRPGNKAKATHEFFFFWGGGRGWGKLQAFSSDALYGNLTTVSCWLTVTRALCLSPYFYLWAYLLFVISCCVTEYFTWSRWNDILLKCLHIVRVSCCSTMNVMLACPSVETKKHRQCFGVAHTWNTVMAVIQLWICLVL